MRSSATTAARLRSLILPYRLREAAERIYDPATIEAKLSGLSGDQTTLLMRLYRNSRAGLTANELRTRAEMVKLFKATAAEIEGDIFRAFQGMTGETWDYTAVRRVGRDKSLLDQINNRIRALGGEIDGALHDSLLDHFKTTWLDGAYRLDVLTPASQQIKFGLLPDREIAMLVAEPWSGARFSDRIGLITTDMAHRIQSEIARSMMAEESWQETARRIRDEMGTRGQRSVWRAEMVARTELAHVQTMANAQLYDENEDVLEGPPVWIAHPGACIECREKHGKPVSEVGYPPEDSHPNCVCDILAIPKSWGGLARNGDDDFSIRPKSRASWARDNGLASVVES